MKNQVELRRRIAFEDSVRFPVTDNVGRGGFRNFGMETEIGSGSGFLQVKVLSFSQERSLSEHLQFYRKSLGPPPKSGGGGGLVGESAGSFSIRERAFSQGEFFFSSFVGVPSLNPNLNCIDSLPNPVAIFNPQATRKKNRKRSRKINDPERNLKRKNLRDLTLYSGIQR